LLEADKGREPFWAVDLLIGTSYNPLFAAVPDRPEAVQLGEVMFGFFDLLTQVVT
jgi:hypothetical protein